MKTSQLFTLFVIFVLIGSSSCGAPAATSTITPPNVLVLVVDIFSRENNNTADQSSQTIAGQIVPVCGETPEGQGEFGSRNPRPTSDQINGEPHGFYVYRELFDSIPLNERGGVEPRFDQQYQNYPWIKQMDYWQSGRGNILFVAVDTDGLNTNSIITNTENSITAFTRSQVALQDTRDPNNPTLTYPQFDRVIVNMSFAYVPCNPMPYITSPLNTLNNSLGLKLTGGDTESTLTLGNAYYLGKDTLEKDFYDYVNQPCTFDDLDLNEKCKKINPSWFDTAAILNTQFNNFYRDQSNLVELVDEAMFEAFINFLVYSPDSLVIGRDYYEEFVSENIDWWNSAKTMLDEMTQKFPEAIFVGAAGNAHSPHPFLPASLDSVISVSSVGSDSTRPCLNSAAWGSNCGEIKMDGFYFGDSSITGTSFAAPNFSYELARLSIDNPQYTKNNLMTFFGYADDFGEWRNCTFDEAVDGKCEPASASSTGGATLKIVSSLPMTGSAQDVTQSIVNAMQMRLERSNYQACGGQYTLQYEAWDDASAVLGKWDPDVETENANKAAFDPSIIAYLGTLNSGAAKLAIPILNQSGPLVMISPANTNPGLTKAERDLPGVTNSYYPTGIRSFARVVPVDDILGMVAANFVKYLGASTVYILDDQGVYSRGIADAFESTAWGNGLTVLGHEGIDPNAADYKDVMMRIATSNNGGAPDAIYVSIYLDENISTLLQDKVSIVGNNYVVKYVGLGDLYSQSFIQYAGAENTEGIYASGYDIPLSALPSAGQQFLVDYEIRYGSNSDIFAVYGYETMSVALKAIEDVCAAGGDPTNRESVRAAVFAIRNFDGVLGNWSFDTNGDTDLTYTEFYQVQNGSYVSMGVFK